MKRQFIDLKSHKKTQQPIKVALLLPARYWAASVLLPMELLQVAGTLAARSDDVSASALFDLQLVAPTLSPVASFSGQWLTPSATLASVGDCQVAMLPPQFAPQGQATQEDHLYAEWLVAQHGQGALLVSLGSAVLLAHSGLLTGRNATGQVSEQALFSRYFSSVHYQPQRRLVIQGNLMTVCGISPAVDACAHVIERFYGAGLARRFLRHTSTEMIPAQEQHSLWSAAYKRHADLPVLQVQEALERDLSVDHRLAELADQVGLSERSLSRRFHRASGLNLRQYVAGLRLELAQFLLRSTDMALVHVAGDCGFASTSALNRALIAKLGQSPAVFRRSHRAQRGH